MESDCRVKFGQVDDITVATILTSHPRRGESYEGVTVELGDRVCANPGPHLLIDFHRVSRVSVCFLADVANLRRVVEAEGGTLRLCGLPRDVHDVLGVLGLERLYLADSTRQSVTEYIGELRRTQAKPFLPLPPRCVATAWPGISVRVPAPEATKGTVR